VWELLQKPHIPLLKEDNVRVGFFERDQFLAVLAHLADRAERFAGCAGNPIKVSGRGSDRRFC
jgi:hypothetical protein